MTNPSPLLTVTIKSPTRTEFAGTANAVSSYNLKGKFDVLPFHSNFISVIDKMVIIHQKDKPDITIGVDKGVMKVTRDTVTVLIGVQTTK